MDTYDSYGNILSIKEGKLEKYTDSDTDGKIAVEMQALESGQVERVLSVVDTEGKVTNYKLNKLGEITGPWPE